jgi:TonB family protein
MGFTAPRSYGQNARWANQAPHSAHLTASSPHLSLALHWFSRDTIRRIERSVLFMFELKTFVPRLNRHRLTGPGSGREDTPKQQRTMLAALTLLVLALGAVLYHDRNFWFPDAQEAQEAEAPPQSPETASSGTPVPTQAVAAKPVAPAHRQSYRTKPQPNASPQPHASMIGASTLNSAPDTAAHSTPVSDSSASDSSTASFTATTTRTALPPLEIEVVAGDVHRTVHPGTNSVRVDLQPDSPTPQTPDASSAPTTNPASDTAASVTSSAAERVQVSADTAEVVSRSVRPGYPLLARQMKVQGSVILQALIGRDGLIQDLRVLSGPPILASAAQEAVKQWHFKPHYQGSDAVETQAKITVNFTISTN